MKRLLLALAILAALLPCASDAMEWKGVSVVGGGVASSGNGCPAGTYFFAYNGDHPSGAGYACFNSGDSSADGTTGGTPTVSSDYVQIDAINEYIYWTAPTTIPTDGTLWLTVYLVGDGDSDLEDNTIAELAYDTSNYMHLGTSGSANSFAAYWNGNGTSDSNSDGAGTVTYGVSYRVGIAWSTTTANPDFSVSIVALGNSPDWDDDNDDLVAWTTAPSTILLGESTLLSRQVNDVPQISDVYLVSGYKTADPLE